MLDPLKIINQTFFSIIRRSFKWNKDMACQAKQKGLPNLANPVVVGRGGS